MPTRPTRLWWYDHNGRHALGVYLWPWTVAGEDHETRAEMAR
jgi:hypothetical protein